MRFRPRYSLLTLLILTALVAGGVKLWRGPHRAVMSHPPTAAERTLLAKYQGLIAFPPPIRVEYDYINTFHGQEWHAVVAREDPTVPAYYLRHSTANMYLLELAETDPAREKIDCWLLDMRTIKRHMPTVINRVTVHMWGQDSIKDGFYFLSNKKHLYRNNLDDLNQVTRVELDEIDDAAFRERVAEELARLPDPK